MLPKNIYLVLFILYIASIKLDMNDILYIDCFLLKNS